MKVLGGVFKGVKLVSPDSDQVRPTVDHLKKHIVRLVGAAKPEVVWDLFAGAGGVGIELLSQGAQKAVFVEQLSLAISCVNLNLAECNLRAPQAYEKKEITVVNAQVETFLKNPKGLNVTDSPDLVFLDPPYGQGFMKRIVPLLLNNTLCNAKTLFIAEHVVEDIASDYGVLEKQEVYGPKVISCFRIASYPGHR